MNTIEKINEILKKVKPTKNLLEVNDLIEGGYIDSFELMHLITEISTVFGIEISATEIIPENFNSIAAMAAMVDRLKK